MTNEELDHVARCEDAMKQARWAIALQLRRWRDGDSICAVTELQNAHDALADLVGESKPEERTNKPRMSPEHYENLSNLVGAVHAKAIRDRTP